MSRAIHSSTWRSTALGLAVSVVLSGCATGLSTTGISTTATTHGIGWLSVSAANGNEQARRVALADWQRGSVPRVDLQRHPADNYEASILAFEQGRYDDAAFHFYAAELRYRIYLQARPDLPPTFEPALHDSLNHVIGMPVRRYLSDKPMHHAAILDAVLRWHDSHDDPQTPKAQFPDAHVTQRERLRQLRAALGSASVAESSDDW